MVAPALTSGLSRESFKTQTGLTFDDIVIDCRALFLQLVGKDCPPWEEIDVNAQQRWTECVAVAVDFLSQEVECKWLDLARSMARAFHGQDQWESTNSAVKLAFEAMTRHACNLIFAVDHVDLQNAQEYDWADWLIQRHLPPPPD